MSEKNVSTLQNRIAIEKFKIINETATDKTTSIEIALPTFYGNHKDIHPKDFLQQIKDYFKIKNIKKTILVNESLRHSAANWYDTVRLGITTFENLKNYFIRILAKRNTIETVESVWDGRKSERFEVVQKIFLVMDTKNQAFRPPKDEGIQNNRNYCLSLSRIKHF